MVSCHYVPDYICINLTPTSALKFSLEKGRLRGVTLKFHQFLYYYTWLNICQRKVTISSLLICLNYRRTGNFLPEGAVNRLPNKLSQVAQIITKRSSTKRNEGHTLQQHRAYWHMKVARYSFSGLILSKFERKLCRHKQTFRKITTICIR